VKKWAEPSDHALESRPGRFDVDKGLYGEQVSEPGLLFVGDQVRAGV